MNFFSVKLVSLLQTASIHLCRSSVYWIILQVIEKLQLNVKLDQLQMLLLLFFKRCNRILPLSAARCFGARVPN